MVRRLFPLCTSVQPLLPQNVLADPPPHTPLPVSRCVPRQSERRREGQTENAVPSCDQVPSCSDGCQTCLGVLGMACGGRWRRLPVVIGSVGASRQVGPGAALWSFRGRGLPFTSRLEGVSSPVTVPPTPAQGAASACSPSACSALQSSCLWSVVPQHRRVWAPRRLRGALGHGAARGPGRTQGRARQPRKQAGLPAAAGTATSPK